VVSCRLVDITGGAPELNPHFRRFITALRKQGQQVQVRTNLTIHLEENEGMEGMLEFFRDQQVQLVASLPCYTEENVDGQRGEGVYHDSVIVLQKLNALGYGIDPELPLNLVYNPGGPSLPPNQDDLEVEYHKQLRERFGIEFHKLFAITNVPIGRFIRDLRMQNRADIYQQLLEDAFNTSTLDGLMCRNQISIDWDGNLYDCDFNLALKKTINHGAPTHISDFNAETLLKRRIYTGNHCFACTAGAGSSCGGALT